MADLIVVPGDVSDILAGQAPLSAGLVLWRHALGALRLLWWRVGLYVVGEVRNLWTSFIAAPTRGANAAMPISYNGSLQCVQTASPARPKRPRSELQPKGARPPT